MKKGFTIIELVVVMAILVVIVVVSVVSLSGSRAKEDIMSATQQIAASLREAQSDSVSDEKGTAWGVYFSNSTATQPFYAFISSSTYSTSTTVGYYQLPRTVVYATSTLAQGATLTISFTPIIGTASVSTTIGLLSVAQSTISSTIMISSSGAVSY